jgi:hypothetical protein
MAEKLLKQPDKNWIKPFSYNANDAFLLNNTMQCNAKERNATQYYTEGKLIKIIIYLFIFSTLIGYFSYK